MSARSAKLAGLPARNFGHQRGYALAADIGGMVFISCMHRSAQQLAHRSSLYRGGQTERCFPISVRAFCVRHPEYKQTETNCVPLKEEDAYSAPPQDAYGWEKLVGEPLCTHYRQDYGLGTRIVRFHNIFGPLGTWMGGRGKAPAALCRKIAVARLEGLHKIRRYSTARGGCSGFLRR